MQQVDVVGIDLVDHPQSVKRGLQPIGLLAGSLPLNFRPLDAEFNVKIQGLSVFGIDARGVCR
jgi:hypothetical protein